MNEVCAIVLAGEKNGCVILGGGSPKNFYLQGQPTLWEVYGIPKGGNEYFIQLTTDQVVWGGLSGATPSEAVSWGKINPGTLPDAVVAYCDTTIAFPLFCEYVVGAERNRRPLKRLYAKRDDSGGRARAPGAGGPDDTDHLTRAPRSTAEWRRGGRRWGRWTRSSAHTSRSCSSRPRVYVDANVPADVIAFMRERLRWDVLAVVEDPELRRASDARHFETARRLRRTLISLDDDFLDPRRFAPEDSPGVVVLSAPDAAGLTRLLRKLDRVFFPRSRRRRRADAAPLPLAGQVLQVHPDWTHPRLGGGQSPRRRRRRRRAPASSHA